MWLSFLQQKKFDIVKYTPQYAGLAAGFAVNPDSCDNQDHYNDYLRTSALSDMKRGMGVTFVYCEMKKRKPKRILGFISLKASALISREDDYTASPALEIAELAVCNGWERKQIGATLVGTAIDFAQRLRSNVIGIQYIVLLADPQAVGFYKSLNPPFEKIADWYAIGNEGWNKNCTGMYLKLPEQEIL